MKPARADWVMRNGTLTNVNMSVGSLSAAVAFSGSTNSSPQDLSDNETAGATFDWIAEPGKQYPEDTLIIDHDMTVTGSVSSSMDSATFGPTTCKASAKVNSYEAYSKKTYIYYEHPSYIKSEDSIFLSANTQSQYYPFSYGNHTVEVSPVFTVTVTNSAAASTSYMQPGTNVGAASAYVGTTTVQTAGIHKR